MGKFSRDKGARGERELAAKLREAGVADAYRSRQYCGSSASADVLGIPKVHAEVKRCEHLSLYKAYEQAKQDSEDSGDMPTVFHRRSGKSWLVVLALEDWMQLYENYINRDN